MTDTDKPTDLSDTDLDAAHGAGSATISPWKRHSLDGKADDAATEGGFSDVSGLGTEVTAVEHREGTDTSRR